MTETYAHLFINYDRNMSDEMESKMARFLLSSCSDTEYLYIDLYATEEDASCITEPRYVQSPTRREKPRILANIFKPISAYVCAPAADSHQLTELWKRFMYSSPKIYRPAQSRAHVSDIALPQRFVENFQHVALEELSELLRHHLCVFRDFHDEVGLEALCRLSFEDKLKELATCHLGGGFIEELP